MASTIARASQPLAHVAGSAPAPGILSGTTHYLPRMRHWEQDLDDIGASLGPEARRAWQELRHGDELAAHRDALRAVLELGESRGRTGVTFHTSSSGTLYVERFADELGATGDALIKPLTGNFNAAGAQEVLSHDIAHAMHIDHMVPVVGRRPNGDAAVELVYGGSLGLNNIHTSWNLEHALRDSWRLRAPDLPAPDINRLARVERHVAMLYKHAIGDIDFHPGNGVWNRETGRMALIDNARLATGEDVLAPVMDNSYRIGPDTGVAGRITTLQLLPEAVEVARSTDLGVLDDAFRRAAQVRPYYGVDSAYADAVRARIKHAAATGSIRMTRG